MLDVSNMLRHNIQKQELNIQLGDIKEIEYNYDKILIDKPIIFEGVITNYDKVLNVTGIIKISFNTYCYSCGKEFEHEQEIEFNETFTGSPGEEEYELLSEKIDLDKAVIDNIVLKLPTKLLCKPDCKGLCSICGGNLNEVKCNCNDLKIDPRFEKLKQLIK